MHQRREEVSLDSLTEEVLLWGFEDWIRLSAIFAIIVEDANLASDGERVSMTYRIVKDLLDGELAVPGDLDPSFVVWEGDLERWLSRLRAMVLPLKKGPPFIDEFVWFDLTEKGMRTAEEVIDRRDRGVRK